VVGGRDPPWPEISADGYLLSARMADELSLFLGSFQYEVAQQDKVGTPDSIHAPKGRVENIPQEAD